MTIRNFLLVASLAGTFFPLTAQVTFSENVAPIIYNRCTGCHRPGEAAPFSLISYDDAAKRGKLIAAVTASRLMPPWRAEPASYPYKDSRRLTDDELGTIQAWVKQGMPKGDPAKAPAPPKFPDGWQLGTPDLVVKMDKGFTVPAEGADIYRYLRIPLNLPDDKWVQAIELRPSGGLALKLPKGTDLMFQYHFHPIGKEETEQSTIGLYFAKNAPEHTLANVQLPVTYGLFSGLDIAPGQRDFRVRDSFVLPVDVQAVSVGAHAHYIGKTMTMTATFPDGTVKTLLDIQDWDFAWQDRYFFEDTILLPKGTKLDSEVSWDNSEENPKNPSRPAIQVRWGEQTKDEMGAVTLQVYPAAESDLVTLQQQYRDHVRGIARERILQDPSLLIRIRELVGDLLPSRRAP